MITPEQQQAIQGSLKSQGLVSPTSATGAANPGSWYTQLKAGSQPAAATAPAGNPISWAGGKIADAFEGGVDQMKEGYDQAAEAKNPLEKTEAGLQEAGGAVGAVGSIFAPVIAPVGKAINAAADKLSDTPLIKGAAGNPVTNPDGSTSYVPNKGADRVPQDLENTANIISLPLGGEAAPAAAETVSSAAGKATDMAATMGAKAKEALTPKEDPAAAAAEATAKQAKAHAAIEDEVRNTAAKYTTVGKALNQAEVTNKTDPIGVLSSYSKGQALPTLVKGKLQVDAPTAFLKEQIGTLSTIKSKLVSSTDAATPVEDFATRVKSVINNQGWSAAKKAAMQAEAQKLTDGLKTVYPDGIPNEELDKLKTEHTQESTSYNSKSPFSLDAHAVVGKAARQLVQSNADGAPIDELNKLIQSHYDAVKVLGAMRGKTPHGGALSRMMGNTIGEVGGLAGGLAVGHPFLGAMAGRAGAEAITEIINNHFISDPLKRSLVNNMKGADPAVVQKALDYLDTSGAKGAQPSEEGVPAEVNGEKPSDEPQSGND